MKFSVLAGFDAGAPTDLIADSLSEGDRWEIGPESDAEPTLTVQLTMPANIRQRIAAFWLGVAS